MKGMPISRFLILWILMLGGIRLAMAQQPELIVVNARIVTVDDASFDSNPGTIAEAMAIRDGRIVAVGNNAQIRAMAGGATQVMDLKGKMVLPGFIMTHEHPSDWDMTNPYLVQKVIPEDVAIHIFLQGPAEQQLTQMEQRMREAVQRAQPGQWIRAVLSFGENYEFYHEVRSWFSAGHGHPYKHEPRILKAHLDAIAPNNPVTVRSAFTGATYNSRAIGLIQSLDTQGANFIQIDPQTGIGAGVGGYRTFEPEILLGDRVDLIVEMERLGLPWWAGYGVTAFNSSIYSPNFLRAYKELDRRGEMAIRFSWDWGWPFDYRDEYLAADIATRLGEGSDYFWFAGLGEPGGIGFNCSTLTPLTEYAKTMKNTCNIIPGEPLYEQIYAVIKAGGRLTGFHTDGDLDIDNLLELIEKASQEAGLSLEQIRARRHGIDHGYGAPRRDQAERIARLGMVMGMMNISIFERPPFEFEHFGERGMDRIVPRKTALDARLMTSFEGDRPLAATSWNVFDLLVIGVTRKSWDGKVYGQNQAVDRVAMLKSATTWGGYYLRREEDLGSLEAGKFADFIVIDKDFLSIPVEQLGEIHVLMTVVGGKVVHLVPSLARDLGRQPAGPQVELGSLAVKQIE